MVKSQLNKSQQFDEYKKNLRIEYSALSNYHNSLIGYRLTLLGFYLAAIALFIDGKWPIPPHISIFGMFITGSLYIFELRTRILFHHIARRAIEIELHDWQFKKKTTNQKPGILPLFSRQNPKDLNKIYNLNIKEDYDMTPIEILGKYTISSKYITHSFALDILYISIFLIFTYSLLVNLFTLTQNNSKNSNSMPTVTLISTQSASIIPTISNYLSPDIPNSNK